MLETTAFRKLETTAFNKLETAAFKKSVLFSPVMERFGQPYTARPVRAADEATVCKNRV